MKLTFVKNSRIDYKKLNNVVRDSLSYWKYSEEQLNKIMTVYSLSDEDSTPRNLYLVFHNKIFVGFFSFIINSNQENELDYFFICKNLIGLGYGRKMWKLCCDEAIALDMNDFVILSLPYSADFYYKMGAEKIGSRPSIIREGVILPILKFDLETYRKLADQFST